MKIGVIGLGHVGAHVVSAIVQKNLASELYLYDLNEKKLIAEINDLEQASLLEDTNPRFIKANLEDLLYCDIVINTASKRIISGDRLKELEGTKEIIYSLFKNFNNDNFKGIIINISNPCDIISYLIHKITGIDSKRVIGTGTLLDSIRFKAVLSKKLNVSPKDIYALVVGEHGESQVNAYSNCNVYGINLETYLEINKIEFDKNEIKSLVSQAGWDIFSVKGATEYGIGSVTAYLIDCIKNDKRISIPFSHPYIFKDREIYISTLAILGENGYVSDVDLFLNSSEKEEFEKSCLLIDKIIANLNA